MKRFLEFVSEFKNWACLCFTAEMCIYVLCSLAWGEKKMDCAVVLEFLGIALIVTLLQYICFSGKVIRKMRYSLRMLVFALPLLGILSLCAVLFQWFPSNQFSYWLIFVGTFLLMLLLITLGFEIYYLAAGKKYDGLLGQYRAKQKQGKEDA